MTVYQYGKNVLYFVYNIAQSGGKFSVLTYSYIGYILVLPARMFRSLIIRTGIKERNIRARNITI